MIVLACPAHAPDLAQLQALQPRAAAWGVQGFLTELQQPHACIWCEIRQGQIIGFLALREVAGFAEIVNVAVHPAHTRQAVARQLLAHALNCLKSRQVQQVSLEVAQDNIPAQRLYAQAGLQVLGKRKDFYGPGCDGLIMGKEL